MSPNNPGESCEPDTDRPALPPPERKELTPLPGHSLCPSLIAWLHWRICRVRPDLLLLGLQEFHSIPEASDPSLQVLQRSQLPGSSSRGMFLFTEKPFTAATAAPVGQKTSQKLLLPLPKILSEPYARPTAQRSNSRPEVPAASTHLDL